ncbi:PD-(D/E)XK nuclease family protein [soil metagenome]
MVPNVHRQTVVVPDRHAFHAARLAAARSRAIGRQILTVEGAVARLAGPFLRAPDTGTVRGAVVRARRADLGDLRAIARLPGFVRAAAASLEAAWEAGIDPRRPPTDHPRWEAIATLEAAVAEHLPADVALPRDLVRMALGRVAAAPAALGPVTLHHVDDVAPCWRPIIVALREHVDVTWYRLDDERPAWLPEGVEVIATPPATGTILRVACATPTHEVVEALRWARSLVACGAAQPHDIAIAAASPAPYDATMLAAARSAGLPLHAVHGIPLIETAVGGLVAALADALVHGLSRDRVRRLVDALGPSLPSGATALLDDGWWRDLPHDAPLTSPARWRRALDAHPRSAQAPTKAWLLELVDDVTSCPGGARSLGERRLDGEALVAWGRALDDGPADAIDATVARLRTGDGVDGLSAIAWGPAATLSLTPRPFVRLLGLTARAWPRRTAEDPLLPAHVLGPATLGESVAEIDRRTFARFVRSTSGTLALSRSRRDVDGRELVPSPLLTLECAATVPEQAYLDATPPVHALDEADRLAARPDELIRHPAIAAATRAWHAWHVAALTPYDGLVRPDHPALVRALGRLHSATSLRRLLRDPQGFVWRYALGWEEPDDAEEPLALDPRALGTLIHGVLERAVASLEHAHAGGLAAADDDALVLAVDEAVKGGAAAAESTLPIPPELAWRRVQNDVRTLALAALRYPLEVLPDARTFVEVPFGRPYEAPRTGAPWDARESVEIGSAGVRIGGYVDRLDIAGDGTRARVVDYKTGGMGTVSSAGGLRGGRELQRCLYALAVRHFLGEEVRVDAVLVFPRTGRSFALDDPDEALERLLQAIDAGHAGLLAGRALPGPDAFDTFNDLRFALPADALRRYRTTKEPLASAAMSGLHDLWSDG